MQQRENLTPDPGRELEDADTHPIRRRTILSATRIICVPRDPHAVQFRREYFGRLLCEPKVGGPLMVELEGRRRLITTNIARALTNSSGQLVVDTVNSRYFVQRLLGREALRG